MTSVLRYDELDMNLVNDILDKKGELLVSLSPKHASALISLIETTRTVQSWSKRRTPFLFRLVPLAKGLCLVLRITIRHSRLFELGQIVVISSASQSWENLPDQNVLFRFTR